MEKTNIATDIKSTKLQVERDIVSKNSLCLLDSSEASYLSYFKKVVNKVTVIEQYS